MGKPKTLGELWDAGMVRGSRRLSDAELQGLAERTEAQLAAHPPGSLRVRREGRPAKGEQAHPTLVRSIRLGESLWALVAIAADQSGVSVNRWIEQAICEKIQPGRKPMVTSVT
jgi:hypothetical protein